MYDEEESGIQTEQDVKHKQDVEIRKRRVDEATVEAAKHVRAAADSHVARQRLMSSFGTTKEGSSDLVARAILTGKDFSEISMLPPTAATEGAAINLLDDDQVRGVVATKYCEDWNETLMLSALPKFLGFGTFQSTSLEAALVARSVKTRKSYDDIAVLAMTTPPSLVFLAREHALDTIFRWKRSGGVTEDAPVMLQSIASTAVPTERDSKRLEARKAGHDEAPALTAYLRPAFVLPDEVVPLLKLETPLEKGCVPMDLLLLRACGLYTYATVHHQYTGFMPFSGLGSMPRTHTSQIEDEFMRHLFMPNEELTELDQTIGFSLFGCDAGFDSRRFGGKWEAPARAKMRHNAKRIAAKLKAGRSSQDAEPLADIEAVYVPSITFTMCLKLAAASLRGPRACHLPRTGQWIRGAVISLEEAVVRVSRASSRLNWLNAFHRSVSSKDIVHVAFESHASIGLGAFKRALHAMSDTIKEEVQIKLNPWYALIPYTRRTDPLPGYLLVAERGTLRAANLLYEMTYRDGQRTLPIKMAISDALNNSTSAIANAVARAILEIRDVPVLDNPKRAEHDVKGMPHRDPVGAPLAATSASAATAEFTQFDVKSATDPESMDRTDIDSILVLVDDEAKLLSMNAEEMSAFRSGRVSTLRRSMYNDDELVNFSYTWPSRLTDPCEFHLPGAAEAVQRTASALRKYLCVTDSDAALYSSREVK
jgi:hypothetical protein